MARLISNNMIVAPTGLNRKRIDDYLDGMKGTVDGIVSGVSSLGSAVDDYMDRQKKQEEDDYIKARNKVSDDMAAERLKMDRTTFQQGQEDRAQKLAEKAARTEQVEKFYAGEHDSRYDSPEGLAAAQAYKEGDLDAFNKLRNSWGIAEANAKNAAAEKQEKDEKQAHKTLRKEVAHLRIPLTKKAWENVGNAEELANTLQEYREQAINMGFTDIQKDIEHSLEALAEGEERKVEKQEATGKAEKKKAGDKALADLFG